MAEVSFQTNIKSTNGNHEFSAEDVLNDYKVAYTSRIVSLVGRKEVLSGKAKFGIFGGGKELPQIVLSSFFENGDFRSGYYRDQTMMLASDLVTVEQLFAQLYANPDIHRDPHSAGRQMNAHFATRSVDDLGEWKDLTAQKNTSADVSCTAAQMGRAVGLAMASKVYRGLDDKKISKGFSKKGNEICFATIGDASTSEGIFWEAVNACGVMKVPIIISVWDDGYGISVPTKYQTTKGNISAALEGFKIDEEGEGYLMYEVNGWDYEDLTRVYADCVRRVRQHHQPAIIHVKELTQPQGHSTSGSHERYKTAERLEWEKDFDCIVQFRKWIIQNDIVTEDAINQLEKEIEIEVKEAKVKAWNDFQNPIKSEISEVVEVLKGIQQSVDQEYSAQIQKGITDLKRLRNPLRRELMSIIHHLLVELRFSNIDTEPLKQWYRSKSELNQLGYSTHTYSETPYSALKVKEVKPEYTEDVKVNGFEVLNKFFDSILQRDPRVLAFGEDLGKIGGVNQGFAGLQEKHGEHRVFDTGIRETTIIGQGIGLAMRGLRPIAEIQYLDYFVYGLQPVADDLATLTYRSVGGQRAPLIIRTRGHRLEGIWHTGSPIGMILNAARGVYLLTPRNMVQAAGLYNTMLQSDDPAIIIECLNGYRLKEKLPSNLGDFTVPLGKPEVLLEGDDVTLVTYGSCVRVAEQAASQLQKVGISCELIDVQTILPFDIEHTIVKSVKKTNRLVLMDEDVPGGATAFMLQQLMEVQEVYYHLDSMPVTITASEHRSPYGSDGDYYCKPNAEQVFNAVYSMMNEVDPQRFKEIF